MSTQLDRSRQSDGGLYLLGWYLAYTPGSKEAVLDGQFEADELIAIGEHMQWVESFDGHYDPKVHGLRRPE